MGEVRGGRRWTTGGREEEPVVLSEWKRSTGRWKKKKSRTFVFRVSHSQCVYFSRPFVLT